jgi:hypothetical protein
MNGKSSILSPWGLFPGPNIQVTDDQKRKDRTSGSRSESDLAVDPKNPVVMIAVSKRFIDNHQYTATIGSSYSTDGGGSWNDSKDLWLDGWVGLTDPALTFDDKSNAYLVAEPRVLVEVGDFSTKVQGGGMSAFSSSNGGVSWTAPPKVLHSDPADDKEWATSDTSSAKYKGNVYACWGANTPLRFARSLDGGASWTGTAGNPPGVNLTEDNDAGHVHAPAMCVSGDGTIHIAWHRPGWPTIIYVESNDGGDSFSAPIVVVDGITDITTTFPLAGKVPALGEDDWRFPAFPGGTFRVMTLVAIAPLGARGCVVAWADCRGPFSRIYYRARDASGSWAGASEGRPVLANLSVADSVPMQHFHPQLAVNGSGVVACAYYEFGRKAPDNLFRIDVKLASSSTIFSSSLPVDFYFLATVTDEAWDPTIDAPWSHGDSSLTFIGEYFGLDASGDDFCVLWTDTRTGKQELWFSRVATWRPNVVNPVVPPALVGQIVYGVVGDGGGLVLLNGYPIPIPPMGPVHEILPLLAAYGIVMSSSSPERNRVAAEIMNAVSSIAERIGKGAIHDAS